MHESLFGVGTYVDETTTIKSFVENIPSVDEVATCANVFLGYLYPKVWDPISLLSIRFIFLSGGT